MPDLSVPYMGLALKNPLVASSSPLTESPDSIRRLEDMGIAAVVLPSLFEEQLRIESTALDEDLWRGAHEFAEATSYLPDMSRYNTGPDGYLELVRRAKHGVAIPVIASLNGVTPSGWVRYARHIEQAGADGIELNLYALETDPLRTGEEIEASYCDLVGQVKSSVRIPVAVKLSPNFTSIANMAKRLDRSGADALVLFNRFYQPDFDIEGLEVVPSLHLSHPHELLPRLHWTAVVFGHVKASLAVTGGVHSAVDVLKCLMTGANAAMMASALLENGVRFVQRVLGDLNHWMEEHEYSSARQMIGSMSHRSVPDPQALQRGNYMKVLSSYALRMR